MRNRRTIEAEPAYSPPNKPDRREDPLDRWQYRIFKLVLFIIAVYFMWQFLNHHVPVGKALERLFGIH